MVVHLLINRIWQLKGIISEYGTCNWKSFSIYSKHSSKENYKSNDATYLPIYSYLIKNSQAIKKGAASKKTRMKKMWNPRWRPRNGCDGRLMAKILITTIQVNLCCLLQVSLGFGTKFTWIFIIKNCAINLPSQLFLGCHLRFHIFFTLAFLEATAFFYSLAVFD